MSVKIMALEAENVKRIKAVALTPSPTGLTIVGGNNNQGKTSVLDALAWALGGDRFRPDAAQRDGAVAPAHLKVKLSNGVVVERKGQASFIVTSDTSGAAGAAAGFACDVKGIGTPSEYDYLNDPDMQTQAAPGKAVKA